jgi:hypothetical protein
MKVVRFLVSVSLLCLWDGPHSWARERKLDVVERVRRDCVWQDEIEGSKGATARWWALKAVSRTRSSAGVLSLNTMEKATTTTRTEDWIQETVPECSQRIRIQASTRQQVFSMEPLCPKIIPPKQNSDCGKLVCYISLEIKYSRKQSCLCFPNQSALTVWTVFILQRPLS